ncbi:MAG: dihydroorotase [bacterium]|nr:dihydroorotase [bacterium]
MKSLLLKGGRVLDPANDLDSPADLLMEKGRVTKVGRDVTAKGAEVLDCSGLLVTPGLLDTKVHLNEPGREDRETIATGTRAAVLGGYTAVACRSTREMVMDNQTVVQFIRRRAARDGVVRVYPIGAVTKRMAGEELAELGELAAAGALAVSDDDHPVADAAVMRRALIYARMFDLPVLSFPLDPELAADGVMHEGRTSTELGLPGVPSVAEEVIAARELIFADSLGCPVHLSPVSSADTVGILRYARERGVPLSAEVTPHNLLLTDAACEGYDTNAKVSPPLRTEADRRVLVGAVADGTISVIASDHSPCTVAEKQTEFARAADGIAGLETAFAALYTGLVLTGELPLERLIRAMTTAPAKVLGLALGSLTPGYPADVTVWDLEREWTVDVEHFASKGRNNPFHGTRLKGRSVVVIVGGRLVVRDGELID